MYCYIIVRKSVVEIRRGRVAGDVVLHKAARGRGSSGWAGMRGRVRYFFLDAMRWRVLYVRLQVHGLDTMPCPWSGWRAPVTISSDQRVSQFS